MLTDRKHALVRKWSNREIAKIAPLFSGETVNVSAWDDRDKEGGRYRDYFRGASSYWRTNYPGHRGFRGDSDEIELDLSKELPAALAGRFDVVFNHTTLEHIFDAREAFANLCKMSKDVVIVVVPFSQVQHESESYGDFWRFTPTCLRALFRQSGLESIYEAESPHRDASIYLLFAGSRHPDRHRSRMPRHRAIGPAGRWIGASLIVSGVQFVQHRIRRLLPGGTRE